MPCDGVLSGCQDESSHGTDTGNKGAMPPVYAGAKNHNPFRSVAAGSVWL